jgi:hypothetical protein
MKIRILIHSMIVMMGLMTKILVEPSYQLKHHFLDGLIFISLLNIVLEYLINRRNESSRN